MLAEYKRSTNIGVGLGLVAEIAGRLLVRAGNPGFGLLILLVGYVLFIWGCTQYAKGKGHSGWFGVLGLFSLLGLLVLFFLPDHHKQATA
ncbi:hypothetical protein [Dyella sp. A6]|uniref:hypothetical protein n=1 Tax=Dyella aluminiiresistens TaxID=3069105 RepID=UPI002E793980|nr:hypothetical protein [Dyella sp. A6]